MIGGRGNDILRGGDGNNVLFGGPGLDTFYIQQSRVVDYEAPTVDVTANDEELLIQLA